MQILKKIIGKLKSDWRWQTALLVIALFLFSLSLRLYQLNRIPASLPEDEFNILVETLATKEGILRGPFDLCYDLGHSCANFYLLAPLVRFFGEANEVFAIRFPLAVSTSIAVVLLFLILRRMKISLLTSLSISLLFSTSYWFLNFSRTAWFNAHQITFLLAIYLVLDIAFQKKRLWLFGVGGILMALALYGYHFSRVMLVVWLVFLIGKVVVNLRKDWKFYARGMLIFLVATLYVFAPQLPAIKANPQYFFARSAQVSFVNSKEPINFIENAKQTVGELIFGLPTTQNYYLNQRYVPFHLPFVDKFTGLLFLGGLALAIFLPWRAKLSFWFLVLCSGLILSLITAYAPNGARLSGVIPVVFIFGAFFFEWLLTRAKRLGRVWANCVCVGLLIGTVLFSINNVYTYFRWAQSAELAEVRGGVKLEEITQETNKMMERIHLGFYSSFIWYSQNSELK